jgi:hypothetical protein
MVIKVFTKGKLILIDNKIITKKKRSNGNNNLTKCYKKSLNVTKLIEREKK